VKHELTDIAILVLWSILAAVPLTVVVLALRWMFTP
jgi:hypothetical protein